MHRKGLKARTISSFETIPPDPPAQFSFFMKLEVFQDSKASLFYGGPLGFTGNW
jgi:hypothetical protein